MRGGLRGGPLRGARPRARPPGSPPSSPSPCPWRHCPSGGILESSPAERTPMVKRAASFLIALLGARAILHADVKLQLVASGLNAPVAIANAGDGSGRLFIVEQGGRIRIWSGSVLPAPFLDIHGIVLAGGERGLLGLAFHPQYAVNGRFFVYYTDLTGKLTIAEYH